WNWKNASENCAPITEQVPFVQVPMPPHVVPSGRLVCVTPVIGSQESAVHVLPSSTVGGVPAMQLPKPLQVSSPLQTVPSAHDVPAVAFSPGWQAPAPSQVSAPLQRLPSSHDVPLGAGSFEQNPVEPRLTQASTVHALLSLHGGGTAGVWAANTPSGLT